MDRSRWIIIRQAIHSEARRLGRLPRAQFSDALIVKLLLWTVAHDRPLCWACCREHYHGPMRPRRLPSVSQFTRRVKTNRVQQLLQRVHDRLTRGGQSASTSASASWLAFDGKSLPVGGASKDPDARRGYAIGGFAKGYKLHAAVDAKRRIINWCVRPLPEHEATTAMHLLDRLPWHHRSLVLADGNYDHAKLHHAKLHQAVADRGGRLLCPPRGVSRSRKRLRAMPAARRESLAVWAQCPNVARWVHRDRC